MFYWHRQVLWTNTPHRAGLMSVPLTVSPKLKLSALRRDSIVRSRINTLKLDVTWLSYTVETIHSKWEKNTEEGEKSGFIGTCCVKWGKEWQSTICREGVRFWTFDIFIHPLHLEQGEDTRVENLLELNVEKTKCTLGTNTLNRVTNVLLVRKVNFWRKKNHPTQPTKITGGANRQIWDVKGSLFVLLI